MWGLRSLRFSPKMNGINPGNLKKNKIAEAILDLPAYSVVSIKRTGGNKRTGGEIAPKIVKRTGCIKRTGWTFCQK